MSGDNILEIEDDRTGVDVATLRRAILDNLLYRCGNIPKLATKGDYYRAVAYTVRFLQPSTEDYAQPGKGYWNTGFDRSPNILPEASTQELNDMLAEEYTGAWAAPMTYALD